MLEPVSKSIISELKEVLPDLIGKRVVVNLPSGDALAEIILTCFDMGVVAVPIDPSIDNVWKQHVIEHSDPSLIVYPNKVESILGFHCDSDPDDCIIVYTSGSTGNPKGVRLGKKALIANAMTIGREHGFDRGLVHATCLPLFHVNAMCMSLIGCHIWNCPAICVPSFNPVQYFKRIEEAGAITASLVPALLSDLLQVAPEWPKTLRYLITAAAPLTSDLASRFYELYGSRIRQGYGVSEATNFTCLMPDLTDKPDEFKRHYIDQHPPIGHVLSGQKIKLASDGELLISGDSLSNGYWLNEKANEKAFFFEDDVLWLRTGDIGEMRDDFVVLLGRSKETINRGGETLYPTDVESVWRSRGLKDDVIALSIDSTPRLIEDIGMCVAPNTDSLDEIVSWTDKMSPQSVDFCFPLRTSTGKPQRSQMAVKLASVSDSSLKYDSLTASALSCARRMVSISENIQKQRPDWKISSRGSFIVNEAKKLVNSQHDEQHYVTTTDCPANEIFEWMDNHADRILCGELDGSTLIKEHPSLWERLMCQWPMNLYPEHAADILDRRKMLDGYVLELGSGVGNLSRLISPRYYTRTDLSISFMLSFYDKGFSAKYDFNKPGVWRNLDTVIACNSLHCSSNIQNSLQHIHNMLRDGGQLLLAEGNPYPQKGKPWALTFMFGLWDGWWNVGGFIDRKIWLHTFKQVGFKEFGYSRIRAGRNDLGGTLWAKK